MFLCSSHLQLALFIDPSLSGPPIEPSVVVGVAAVLVRGEAPDGARDLKDGLLVQGVKEKVGPATRRWLTQLQYLHLRRRSFAMSWPSW
jgi:hypothetical protein